jgi:beta-glucosidase
VASPAGLAWTGSGEWIGIALAAFLIVALGIALRLRRPRDRR